MDDSEQALHGILRLEACSQPVAVTAIYAKCTRAERYPLWDKLRDLADNLETRPCIIGGDFNTILNPRDRSGSESNRKADTLAFAEAIEDCRLVDVGFDGAPFTWAMNNLFERLDRVFINEQWMSVFEATRITNLPRVTSDHGPILVRCKTEVTGEKGRNFRFQNMWLRHEGFRVVVESSWSQPTEAGGLLNLQIKLARLKKVLKEWNRATFGNLQSSAEATIVLAQQAFEADASPTNRCRVNKAIADYILLLKMEDLWRQRAAVRWIKEGDRNTKFYQSWVKQKRARLRIHGILAGDRTITDEREIKDSASNFFQELLAPSALPLADPDLNLILRHPQASDLESLATSPNEHFG
ncbi:uncharacterized protein LOC121796780 [Salvia splendens]|uniref:uncharacterized protein LOC121796780 n=1 Tax=Salvia splendens TaxID=180675 RepID=UPI001C280203|nr:uncharacterized protein LOC121796780 [Salvia splendens]